MATARIVEAVDVFEDGDFGITTRSSGPLPQKLGLDRLEECLDRRVRRRASATRAFRSSRLLAIFSAQPFSAKLPRLRVRIELAAS